MIPPQKRSTTPQQIQSPPVNNTPVKSQRGSELPCETPKSQPRASMEQQPVPSISSKEKENLTSKQRALDKAGRMVLDAEQMRANLVTPQGMLPIKIDQNIQLLRNLDSDDDFFHVSCHIDQVMKDRIQKGEFVDLEKLLPKEKGSFLSADEGLSLEVVTKDGHPFLAP